MNQSTKTRDAQASLGYPDLCFCCDGRPTMHVLRNAEKSRQDIHIILPERQIGPYHCDVPGCRQYF